MISASSGGPRTHSGPRWKNNLPLEAAHAIERNGLAGSTSSRRGIMTSPPQAEAVDDVLDVLVRDVARQLADPTNAS
jgi:hypothetical protein